MLRVLQQFILTTLFAVFASQASAMFIQADWFDPTQPGVGTNRYAYSFNDPINKMDPGGNAVETPWDVLNVILGAGSFGANVYTGNIPGAIVDGMGLVYDGAATVVPGLPAGGSAGILVTRIARAGKALKGRAAVVRDIAASPGLRKDIVEHLQSATRRVDGAANHSKVHDILGMVKEKLGIPLESPKPGGSPTGHIQEVTGALNGLTGKKGAIAKLDYVLRNAEAAGLSKRQIRQIEKLRTTAERQAERLERIMDAADKAKDVIDDATK